MSVGDLQGRGHFAFVPVDHLARDGRARLLRDYKGGQHCGRWDGEKFVYAAGAPIVERITAYCARIAPLPKLERIT